MKHSHNIYAWSVNNYCLKDKFHEVLKAALLQKLMKFWLYRVCQSSVTENDFFKSNVLCSNLWRHKHNLPHETYLMIHGVKNDVVYHCSVYTVLSLLNEVY